MMADQNHSGSDNKEFFQDPWTYFGVPEEDMRDLFQLYATLYLNPAKPTLPGAMQQIMYPDDFIQVNMQFRDMASPKAHEAAKWFVIADFIGMKYERFHPTFTMREVPGDVLQYLRPPFNGMKLLGYEDQKQFHRSLPDKQKREVFIDG